MGKIGRFFRGFWQVISFPFRALWGMVRRPLHAFKRAEIFVAEEPDEHPLTEILADVFQDPSGLFKEIDVLRKHLLRMVLALIIGVTISAVFTTQIIDLLSQTIGGIATLQAIDVTESVGTFMLVALVAGFSLALPYIAFELWLFIGPGLRPRARLMGLLGIPLALIFFLGGMAFCLLRAPPDCPALSLELHGYSHRPTHKLLCQVCNRTALLDRHRL